MNKTPILNVDIAPFCSTYDCGRRSAFMLDLYATGYGVPLCATHAHIETRRRSPDAAHVDPCFICGTGELDSSG